MGASLGGEHWAGFRVEWAFRPGWLMGKSIVQKIIFQLLTHALSTQGGRPEATSRMADLFDFVKAFDTSFVSEHALQTKEGSSDFPRPMYGGGGRLGQWMKPLGALSSSSSSKPWAKTASSSNTIILTSRRRGCTINDRGKCLLSLSWFPSLRREGRWAQLVDRNHRG